MYFKDNPNWNLNKVAKEAHRRKRIRSSIRTRPTTTTRPTPTTSTTTRPASQRGTTRISFSFVSSMFRQKFRTVFCRFVLYKCTLFAQLLMLEFVSVFVSIFNVNLSVFISIRQVKVKDVRKSDSELKKSSKSLHFHRF